MRNTLKRALAIVPVAAALALGAMAAPAQATAPTSTLKAEAAITAPAKVAAAVVGDCTIKVNGVVIDRGYVTKSLCVQVANYWAGVYFPTPVTYTWYPLV